MQRLWIISYDIASDRRRYRLSRFLLGLGDRVEESVFECYLRADQLPAFSARISGIIDPGEDAVALVPVCRDCRARFQGFGRGAGVRGDCPHFTVV